MSAPEESLRDKLIVAVVQTLIFGALLAVVGYWLNLRLETFKHTVSSLEPLTVQRRSAYLDFQQAARKAKEVLEIYYYRAKGLPPQEARLRQLEELRHAFGIGGGGSGGGFVIGYDVYAVVEELFNLRIKYEDVSSAKVNAALDEFIFVISKDLIDGMQKSNDTEAFHNSAQRRLREA
jgi:hypothetical protein